MKKKKVIISYKARTSIKKISDYLKENASDELAKNQKKRMPQIHRLKS